jgi:hypothetical protein
VNFRILIQRERERERKRKTWRSCLRRVRWTMREVRGLRLGLRGEAFLTKRRRMGIVEQSAKERAGIGVNE